jgi:4-alpha-glucanotransferase
MNTPASAEGNWAWRLADGTLTQELRDRLKDLTTLCARLPQRKDER